MLGNIYSIVSSEIALEWWQRLDGPRARLITGYTLYLEIIKEITDVQPKNQDRIW